MQKLGIVSPRWARGSLRHRVRAAAVIAVPLLGGCRETLTQVESGVVESGTWPALQIEQPLPSLGDVIGTGRPGAEVMAVVDRWEASWDHGTAVGGDLRQAVYLDAAALPLTVDSVAVRVATESVRDALAEVSRFGGSLPPHLTTRIAAAGRFLREAEMASGVGDWSGAGLNVARAADALRETSPRSVALTLAEVVEDALGPPPPEVGAEPVGMARARRLAWWSRIAIRREQYSLAIQRGYYACLLLGVRLP